MPVIALDPVRRLGVLAVSAAAAAVLVCPWSSRLDCRACATSPMACRTRSNDVVVFGSVSKVSLAAGWALFEKAVLIGNRCRLR